MVESEHTMQQPMPHQLMGYDRAITMFSPDGRLLQVEYAKKTVKQGSTAIGLACSDGVVLVADKRIVDKLVIPETVEKIFQLDEHIRGTVHKIAARTTTIITAKNYSVIVPNRDLLSKSIVNWGRGRFAVGFEINIIVEYNSDAELVKKILMSVVHENPTVLRVPGIITRLENFDENGLNFLIRAFISARRVREQWEIAGALRMEILKEFAKNQIRLAYPHRIISYQLSEGENIRKAGSLEIKFDRE